MARTYKIKKGKKYRYWIDLSPRVIRAYQIRKDIFKTTAKIINELIAKGYFKLVIIRGKRRRWEATQDFTIPFPVEKVYYRCSKVHMFYSVKIGGNTPTPFCELRAIKFLDRIPTPDDEKELDEALNRLEWIFTSIWWAKREHKVRTEIIGFESEKISEGEARGKELNVIYRYVAFFDNQGNIRKDYDEDDIARLEGTREFGYAKWKKDKMLQARQEAQKGLEEF